MDTITEPHVNGGHDAPRRLRREPGGRIAGVCQGLGTYLGIDANVVRILFVLGAFAGGAGIAAYVAAWVLLPTSDDPSPEPLRLRVDGPVRAVVLALVALFAGWAFIGFLWAPWGFGPGRLAFGALLVAAGLIVLSRRGDGAPVAASAGVGGATSVVPPAPPAPPAPFLASWRNRASVALAGLLAAGGAVALAAALTGAFAPSLVELSGLVLAVLVVVPVAMVFLGLGRGVVALGALGALAGLAFCLPGPSFAHGAGQRDLVATTPSELQPSYVLGAGDVRLDLSQLDLAGATRTVRVRVGAGNADLIVPPNTEVQVHGAVSAGQVLLFGRDERGLDASLDVRDGTGPSHLVIDAEVGYGRITVDR